MTVHDHGNGDDDSLFGSPPSSPVRGRSPLLALPTGPGSQNVGTIALPGSHSHSEYPVHPLALSWRATPAVPPRPPAQPTVVTGLAQPNTRPENTSRTPNPASLAIEKKKRAKRKKATPRPAAPALSLPDLDAPPSANFLRNQQALLGIAGLVGRINPATLSTQRPLPGSTRKHPIVVDDEHDQPRLGRTTQPNLPINPSIVTPPSQQQILESLIKQKNIFPVLESLLKLLNPTGISRPTSSRSTPECRRTSEEPQQKKRRLSSVPAGAADWDVPFPFAEGEGPQEYRANWERNRCRQLIVQLVDSLKTAARTAATKEYMQRKHTKERSATPSKPIPPGPVQQTNASADTPMTNVPSVSQFAETASSSAPSQCVAAEVAIPASQVQFELDQFLSSISQTQNDSGDGIANGTLDDAIPEMDPAFYQSWQSLLDSFSVNDLQQEANITAPSVTSDGMSCFDPDLTSVAESATPPVPDFPDHSAMDISFPDFAIDPGLLALPPSTTTLQGPTAQPSIPNPDPFTPNWELAFPNPEICTSEPGMYAHIFASDAIFQTWNLFAADQSSMNADGPCQLSEVNEQPSASQLAQPLPEPTPASMTPFATVATFGTAVGVEDTLSVDEPSQPPAVVPQTPTTATSQRKSPLPRLSALTDASSSVITNLISTPFPALGTTPAGATTSSGRLTTEKREDILQRARERRSQLVAEIERAKIELWETTIEQGVLAHIAKEKL